MTKKTWTRHMPAFLFALRRSASGSPPAFAILRMAKADLRASASETTDRPPRPIGHRRP